MKNDTYALGVQLSKAQRANEELWSRLDVLQEALRKADSLLSHDAKLVVFSEPNARRYMEVREPVTSSKFSVYRLTMRIFDPNGDLVGIVLRCSKFNRPLIFGMPPEEAMFKEGYNIDKEITANMTEEEAVAAVCDLVAEFGTTILPTQDTVQT